MYHNKTLAFCCLCCLAFLLNKGKHKIFTRPSQSQRARPKELATFAMTA